jgi:hypothetical protein
MSLRDFCTPRPLVFSADRRATVLSLDIFLKGEVEGRSFFEENYFTGGMLTLVDRAFRHLTGLGAGSLLFQLSQAFSSVRAPFRGGATPQWLTMGAVQKSQTTPVDTGKLIGLLYGKGSSGNAYRQFNGKANSLFWALTYQL